jgi:short-subunit dehydrogenase
MAISLKPVGEQVIVITGASSGIGLATAELAAEQGAKLVLAARSGDTLDDVAARLSRHGAEAMAVDADVGNRVEVQQLALAAIERFGRIDTWVNNAGVSIYGRLDEVTEEDSRKLFETNFWGVVHGSLVALHHMRANGGAIINLGSEVSDAVIPLQGMYSASKHAVKGFTDALRVEVEEIDQAPVAITLIQPTAVDTPYPEHARNYMNREPKLPVDPIDPGEVAEAILKAAAHHARDVKVGAMSKINTTIAKVLPKVGDKMSAKMADKQKRDERPRDPAGGLHEPRGGGRTNGR